MDQLPPPPSHYEWVQEDPQVEEYQPPLPNDIRISSLENFQKEAHDLYRSAQPLPWHLTKLKKNGVDVVINFALFPDLPLKKGPEHLIHIPSLGEYPSVDDVIDFLQVINYIRQREAAGEKHKILIHCIYGKDRTGLMAAAYQRVFEDRSIEEVEREYAYFGHTDFTYFEELFGDPLKVEYFRNLSKETPKEKYLVSFW